MTPMQTIERIIANSHFLQVSKRHAAVLRRIASLADDEFFIPSMTVLANKTRIKMYLLSEYKKKFKSFGLWPFTHYEHDCLAHKSIDLREQEILNRRITAAMQAKSDLAGETIYEEHIQERLKTG